MGSSTENSAYGPTLNPWDTDARPGRLERRLGGVGRRGHGAVVDRHGHRRLDPPARRAVRDRGDEAHLRRDQPLRDDRLRVLARPGRPVHARRHRLRAAAVRDGRRRPVRQHEHRPAGADRAPDRDRPEGHPARRPRGALGRGHRARRAGDVPGDAGPRPRTRRDGRDDAAPARAARPRRVLPDRARRVQFQPRPLRRRPLRLPGGGVRRPARHVHRHARGRLRRRGQAPRSCSAPTR